MTRIPQLDGLRAIAVICVMAFHFIPWIDQYAPLGMIGVRTFFVLSGFLITRILLAARGQDVASSMRTFYLRRSLRIFPVFYLTLAIAWSMNIGPVRSTLGWHVTYLTNAYLFTRGDWHGSISHLWSLAVEEQFYLVWPWLMLLLPERWLRPLIVVMIAAGPLSRTFIASPMNAVVPISCLDALGAGALLAFPDTRALLTGTGIFASPPSRFIAKLLAAQPLVYLGTISYGVYLFHGFMPYLMGRYVPGFIEMPWQIRFTLLSASTILAASVSWRWFESPILRLKDRVPATLSHRLAA